MRCALLQVKVTGIEPVPPRPMIATRFPTSKVAPRTHLKNKQYELLFCADGHGYVERADGEAVKFDNHESLARFLIENAEVRFAAIDLLT